MMVRSRWLASLAVCSLALGYASCGDSTSDAPLGVNNVSPQGSVGGLLLKADTMEPFAGVTVQILAGGQVFPAEGQTAVKTDAQGIFQVDQVPAGELIVLIKTPDTSYFSVNIPASLDDAAGEWPRDNATLSLGPIGLVPKASKTGGAFTVQLVAADGSQAPNVKGYLRTDLSYVDFSGGTARAKGTVVDDTTSDSEGLLTFSAIPDYNKLAGLVGTGGIDDQVILQIPAADTDKDGEVDFLGTQLGYSANTWSTLVPTVILSNPSLTSLQVKAASIAALLGQSGNRLLTSTSGPLYVTFNLPLDQSLTTAKLSDEWGALLSTGPTVTITDNIMKLSFTGLKQGGEYNLSIYATATEGAGYLQTSVGAPIFTPPLYGSKVTATLTRDTVNTDRIIMTFSEPVGTGSAGENLNGADAVLYFDYDINGSGIKGDASSESGYSDSNTNLLIKETDPVGPAGLSGLSSRWYFNLPTDSVGTPLPSGTSVNVLFSRSSKIMIRASGEHVSDIKSLTIPN